MREHIQSLPKYDDGDLVSWYQNDQKYTIPAKLREDYDEKKEKEIKPMVSDEELERQEREEEKKGKSRDKANEVPASTTGSSLTAGIQKRKAKHLWDMEKVNESPFAGATHATETETSHLGQLTNLQPVSHNVTMRYDELQHKRGSESGDLQEQSKLTELKGPFNLPPNRRDKWPQGIATESATVSGTATTSPSIQGSITQQLQVLRQKMKQP